MYFRTLLLKTKIRAINFNDKFIYYEVPILPVNVKQYAINPIKYYVSYFIDH